MDRVATVAYGDDTTVEVVGIDIIHRAEASASSISPQSNSPSRLPLVSRDGPHYSK